jgi:hypothetical protein
MKLNFLPKFATEIAVRKENQNGAVILSLFISLMEEKRKKCLETLKTCRGVFIYGSLSNFVSCPVAPTIRVSRRPASPFLPEMYKLMLAKPKMSEIFC